MINLEGFAQIKNNYGVFSKSQMQQDLFVLYLLQGKKDGFFVDFGATNGFNLNNTYILEKFFNWKGILAEPNRAFQTELFRNRDCFIETRAVYSKSNEIIMFNESEEGELSSIESYVFSDHHGEKRKLISDRYEVETISLDDLLIKYEAPEIIDYLSIDTEGSEFDILNNFSFEKQIKIITVEHNYQKVRDDIKFLLESKNYMRVFEQESQWDDWYISKKFFNIT